MSILKDLHIVNPYNDLDLKLIKKFCQENNNKLYEDLGKIRKNYSEEQYKHQEEVNIINKKNYYTLKEDKISNFIYAELEKDTKTANLYPTINNYIKNLIPELSEYLIMNNNMEKIFVFVKKGDINTAQNLLENNFLSLSTEDEEEYIPFLKENQTEEGW